MTKALRLNLCHCGSLTPRRWRRSKRRKWTRTLKPSMRVSYLRRRAASGLRTIRNRPTRAWTLTTCRSPRSRRAWKAVCPEWKDEKMVARRILKAKDQKKGPALPKELLEEDWEEQDLESKSEESGNNDAEAEEARKALAEMEKDKSKQPKETEEEENPLSNEASEGFKKRATAKAGDLDLWDPKTKTWKKIE